MTSPAASDNDSAENQSLFRIEPRLAGRHRECAAFQRSPFTTAVLIHSICALTVIGCLFAGNQSLARKATITGRVELTGGELKLFPDRRRRVSELKVETGTKVIAGQVLAVLHDLQHQPDLLANLDQQRALLTESAAAAETDWLAQSASLQTQLQLIARSIKGAKREIAATKSLLELAREQSARGEELHTQGHLALSQYEELQKNHSQQQKLLATSNQQHLQLQTQAEALRQQLHGGERDLQRQLREIQHRKVQLATERAQLLRNFQQILRAPAAGRITGVLKHVGATIDPQSPLFTMVSTNTTFRAELWASSSATGELVNDQKVNLMLDAFPHQKHGMLPGRISHINNSPLTLRELGVPWAGSGPAYQVTVDIDSAHPLYQRIKPGMNLKADIKLDNSLLVERLFEPLIAAWQRSV